jgi:hypothetical protein
MRLYHERPPHRSSARMDIGPGDEEECYTAVGRRQGVWLTTQALVGETVVSCDVETDVVEEFEVTSDGDEHRTFVVPAALTTGFSFS